MVSNILKFIDYKEFINSGIRAHRHLKGYRGSLADTLGIQRSYLSQILRGKPHLNLDQAIRLAETWGLLA